MAHSRQPRLSRQTENEHEETLPRALDVVALLAPVAGHPVGTLATVLEVDSARRTLMLEIAAPDGRTLLTPSVPAADVRLTWSASSAPGYSPTP